MRPEWDHPEHPVEVQIRWVDGGVDYVVADDGEETPVDVPGGWQCDVRVGYESGWHSVSHVEVAAHLPPDIWLLEEIQFRLGAHAVSTTSSPRTGRKRLRLGQLDGLALEGVRTIWPQVLAKRLTEVEAAAGQKG